MTYRFETSKGTVEISVSGEYDNGCKDVDVSYEGADRTFEECDDADEIIQWLVDEGVKFESMRSCAFNKAYIQHVLIEEDATEQQLLNEAAMWTDADIAVKLYCIAFKDQEPDMLSVKQAADALGVTRARVNQLIASNLLDAVRIGEYWSVSRASVERRRSSGRKPGRPSK